MLATQICEEEYDNSRISAIGRIDSGRIWVWHSTRISSHTSCFYADYGIYSLPAVSAVSHAQQSAAIALNSDSFGRFRDGCPPCKWLRAGRE